MAVSYSDYWLFLDPSKKCSFEQMQYHNRCYLMSICYTLVIESMSEPKALCDKLAHQNRECKRKCFQANNICLLKMTKSLKFGFANRLFADVTNRFKTKCYPYLRVWILNK